MKENNEQSSGTKEILGLGKEKKARIFRMAVSLMALLSLLFLFGSAYVWKPGSVFTFSNGFSFIFGLEVTQCISNIDSAGVETARENGHACFTGLFGLIFAILGILSLLISSFFKKESIWKITIFSILSFVFLLTSGILFLSSKAELSHIVSYIISDGSEAVANTIYKNGNMGYGFIVTGVLLIAASIGSLSSVFIDGSSSILKEKIDRLVYLKK